MTAEITEKPVVVEKAEQERANRFSDAPSGGERRKRSRQPIETPIAIVRYNGEVRDYTGMTRDVSSGGGVCFDSPRPLDAGARIGYIVTLSPVSPAVRIGCTGNVLRCNPHEEQDGIYTIAASMDQYRFLPS